MDLGWNTLRSWALAMRMYPLLHRLLEQRDAQMSKLQELSRPVQRRPLSEDKPHQEGSEDFEGEGPNDEREEIFLFSPTENNSFFFCLLYRFTKEFE